MELVIDFKKNVLAVQCNDYSDRSSSHAISKKKISYFKTACQISNLTSITACQISNL